MAEKQGAAAKQERKQKRRGRQISVLQISTAVFGGCTKGRIAEHW